ncbi:hypothetical protein [uncultured Tenacibaculum sp.]|uniref:hypothetical protein n=1 Tax=uncultured Tenacibaculum sp. TaxID=174713 RepID=UPI002603C4D2|nr:hypothetical protein [uncultured Tenacibaculum sp.]
MTLNIINRNYIFRHKYFVVFKIIGVAYFYFLLRYTSPSTDDSFLKYEHLIETTSLSFAILTFVLVILNGILYSKYGQIIIEYKSITILKNGWKKKIKLAKIKSIRVEKLTGNEFLLKLDKFIIDLEISPTELEKLKKLEMVTPIKFDKPSIIDKIKSRLRIFARNKDFMDEPYRK